MASLERADGQPAPLMDLPLNADGECMRCHKRPDSFECLSCCSCGSPWHVPCLLSPIGNVSPDKWPCPDCNISVEAPPSGIAAPTAVGAQPGDNIAAKVRAIEAEPGLTQEEKARRRQELFNCSSSGASPDTKGKKQTKKASSNSRDEDERRPPASSRGNATLDMLDERMNCMFCLQLVDRPVTTPCGHNFCLKCFQRWVGQGKKTCAKCRAVIPPKMASQPRINSALVVAIRLAKAAASGPKTEAAKHYHHIANIDRPTKAFTTERAVKAGKANACSGRIFVTIPPDHFGPITADYDPERNQGVLVGETWEDRMECRQWGAHFPHVAGIAGQSDHGAQSVALSGGYEDDMDMGEYFLYTGSGGRDLSGNKRTNKEHSFDQKFESANEALRLSCKRGYPVRVVRSHKEKRSNYAPESGVRYDGIYRIEKCWRKKGAGGYLVCRYLFVRCDNEPAPWTTDEHGDRPRELPNIAELREAKDVTNRGGKGQPAWDWKAEEGVWGWTCDPPSSRKMGGGSTSPAAAKRKQISVQQRLLKEFGCKLCGKVLNQPVSTPCGHNFCKACLEGKFGNELTVRNRNASGRSLRVQKVPKPCPASRCGGDIAELLVNLQVNREMVDVIETLKANAAKEKEKLEGIQEEEQSGTADVENANEGQEPTPSQEGSRKRRAEAEAAAEGGGESSKKSRSSSDGGANGAGSSTARAILLEDEPANPSTCHGEEDHNGVAGEGAKPVSEISDRKNDGNASGPSVTGEPRDPVAQRRQESLRLLREKFPDFDDTVVSQTLDDEEGDFHGALSTLKQLKRLEAKSRRAESGKAA